MYHKSYGNFRKNIIDDNLEIINIFNKFKNFKKIIQ